MTVPPAVGPTRVTLLGSFRLGSGERARQLPLGAKRLVAFLALERRIMRRSVVAEVLWPNVPRHRSLAHLRGAIWQAHDVDPTVMVCDRHQVALSPGAVTDVDQYVELSRTMVDETGWAPREVLRAVRRTSFFAELLPEFSEEWAVIHRARFDQLRLHALETLAERLVDDHLLAQAIDVAIWTTQLDPLRESPRRILIRAYAEEGNYGDAVRQYRSYRDLLVGELGVQPSPYLSELVGALGHGGSGCP